MGTGYEPLNVLKPVAEGIWLVDGPAIRFYGMPFSTRMTVVQLANGDVWLHSPTQLTEDLADAVSALGPTAHLVAPNWIHYAYVTEWQKRFPQAVAWGAPGVRDRAVKYEMDVEFDHDLGPIAEVPWRGQVEQMIVEGSKVHREAVFFHKPSSTLILTDLIENFEPTKLPWWMRGAARLAGIVDPDGRTPLDMRLTFSRGQNQLRAAVETMIAWAPERVILAHGRWYEQDAVEELKRAFRFVL